MIYKHHFFGGYLAHMTSKSNPKPLIPTLDLDFSGGIELEIHEILKSLDFQLSDLPSKFWLMENCKSLKKQTNPSQVVSVFLRGDGVYKIIDLRQLQLCLWNIENEITLMVRAEQQNAKHIMPLYAMGLSASMELALRMPAMLSLRRAMHQNEQLLGSAAFAACLRQGLEGLLWLQEMEYVHGDIHDGNIFFKTENGDLVLVLGDLGSAQPYQLFGSKHDFIGFIEALHLVSMYNPNDRQLLRVCSIKYDVFAFAHLMGTQLFRKPLYTMARAAEGLDAYHLELQFKEIVKEDIIQTLQPDINNRIQDPLVINVLQNMLNEWDARPDANEALEQLGESGLAPVKSLAQN